MNSVSARGLWLAIITLSAVLVGGAAGLLSWVGGMHPAVALLTAGGATGGSMLLGISAFRFGTGDAD